MTSPVPVPSRDAMANYPPQIGDNLYQYESQTVYKQPVRLASNGAVANLSSVTVANFDGAGQGVTLVQNDRVLVKNNASKDGVEGTAAKRNGIYIVGAVASGSAPLTRDTDADASAKVTSGMQTDVMEGTYAGQSFVLTTANPITLDTTSLTFATSTTSATAGSAITAGTTRTQAGATALTKGINRVDTSTAPSAGSTLGDGVVLPASAAGTWVVVINNTANNIQCYGNGSDTINGVAGSTGVVLPPGDLAWFACAAAGSWQFDAGMGSSGTLPIEIACDSVSAAGSTQGAATQLVAALNRVTTATANQGVKLPASAPGMDVIIENHSGVAITVYGAGTDKIDDVASATGMTQMDSSVVIFTCYAAGNWYTNGAATGYAKNPQGGVVLETVQYADALTAAGTTQGTGLQLSAAINNVTTVGAGSGVNLPASAPGLAIVVQNNGANALLVYPAQGASDTINGVAAANGVQLHAGTAATFNCTAAGAWTTAPVSPKADGYQSATNTTGFTATGAQISGAVAQAALALTGTLGGAANLTLPLVTNLVLALHAPTAGTTYRLRIINQSPANFAWTVVMNTGWTLAGGMVVPQNSYRDFDLMLTSLTTATLTAVGAGPFTSPVPEVTTSLSAVGAGTLSAAGITGGIVQRSGSQSNTNFTDTTDTVANIQAAVPNFQVGQSWEFTYENQTNAAATIAGASSVTVSGITVVPPGTWARYLVTLNGASTVTMVGFASGPNVGQEPPTRTTTSPTNATATMSSGVLSDLTVEVTAGQKIQGLITIFANNSTAGEGLQFDLNGGTASFTSIEFGFAGTPAGGTVSTATSTAIGTAISCSTVSTSDACYTIAFAGVVNLAGTIIPRFAEVSHSTGTATVKLNSSLTINTTAN